MRDSGGPNVETPMVAVTALTGVTTFDGGAMVAVTALTGVPTFDGDAKFAATIRKPVDPLVLVTTVEAIFAEALNGFPSPVALNSG